MFVLDIDQVSVKVMEPRESDRLEAYPTPFGPVTTYQMWPRNEDTRDSSERSRLR